MSAPPARARNNVATRTRVRLAQLLTAFICTWPLAHYPLVQSFSLSPWSFGGFAMYTTPLPSLQARDPLMAEAGDPLRAIAVEALPAPVRKQVLEVLGESLQQRSVWGQLYDPAPQAQALLELSPSATDAVVSIEQCWLDARAFTACTTHQYLCTREPSKALPRCAPSRKQLRVGDLARSGD